MGRVCGYVGGVGGTVGARVGEEMGGWLGDDRRETAVDERVKAWGDG